MATKPKVLFLMYDGLTDSLGQSQVLSYVEKLSYKYSFDIIGFEKPDLYKSGQHNIYKIVDNSDIRWIPISYTKHPPIISTIYDFYRGWLAAIKYGDQSPYDLVHCRSSVIGFIALAVQKKYGSKLIFDMRGWWADEKNESGLWNSPIYKIVYRFFKELETKLFQKSDHSISLTYAGVNEIVLRSLKPAEKLSVIPTCVNFEIFKAFDEIIRNEVRRELEIGLDDTVLLYSGSLGGNYSMELILGLYKSFKKLGENTKILFLSQTDVGVIKSEILKCDVSLDDVRIQSCNYTDVHRYLMAGDFGIVNYTRSYSSIGRSPTKLGEYWACGLPVVSEAAIADIDLLVNKYPGSGYLIDPLDQVSFDLAVKKLQHLDIKKEQLREYAIDYYDLEKGVEAYLDIYKKVLC